MYVLNEGLKESVFRDAINNAYKTGISSGVLGVICEC